MSNHLRSDIYDRIQRVVSMQDVEWLVQSLEDSPDESPTEDWMPHVHFALSMLTESEFDLLFFRYFQGNSYKTLKRTNHLGSKKTAANRLKRIPRALKSYAIYHSTNVLEDDLDEVEILFGSDGRRIAEMLFSRCSKTKISKTFRQSKMKISRKRLFGTIKKMGNTFRKHEVLSRFWAVIESFGKE